MKKTLIIIVLILVVFRVISVNVTNNRKNKLRNEISKGSLMHQSQVALKMAREGNVSYFEDKELLHEDYGYMDILENSYIHEAVRFKQYKLINFFISKNKKFNFKNNEGLYPITLAAKNCDTKMIEILKPVSKSDLRDNNGNTWEKYYINCKNKI